MSGADYDPFGDRISVVQEPPDDPMWLQQSTPEFANGYQRGWHAAQVTRAPLATWRGSCGHLWDRSVEDTDECPRCALATLDAERASRPSVGEAALRETATELVRRARTKPSHRPVGEPSYESWLRSSIEDLAAALATPVPADDRERRDTTGVRP